MLATGLFLCFLTYNSRLTALEIRIYTYLPQKQQPTQTNLAILNLITPLWETLGSSSDSVQNRLQILGNAGTLTTFRLYQISLSTFGATLIGMILLILNQGNLTILTWLIATALSFISITLLWDKYLTYRVKTFARKLNYQVADAAELLALVISAGESLPGALHRVAKVSGPQMKTELASALNEITQGTPVSKALTHLEERTPSPQLKRLLNTLVSGMERGASLSEILRHQAKDLREESLRNLLEAGGRKEIAMLLPVVFLILPVTVIFALYPGLIALRF